MTTNEHLGQNQLLLKKLRQIVLSNLDNENFSVEDLASSYGISRSHLHRKLKRLKGHSISQFIREIRLNEALEMLQNDIASVSEIAYRVGFNSSSYFNTCFHNKYGYSPGKVKYHNHTEEINPPTSFSVTEENLFLPGEKINIDKSKKKSSSKIVWFMISGTAAAAAFLLIFLAINWSDKGFTKTEPKSIAILPLAHLSNKKDQEYLTSGIHDALIGELGSIKGLRVISRISTLKYGDGNLKMTDIANELGVEALVEGSVVFYGDSLRLQLQLIDVYPKENHIWAEDYHKNVNEILSLQSTVIEDIANSIEIGLTDADKERLDSQKTTNPETYKAYLRGMYYLTKSTAEEFNKGLEYLHLAVEIDPADAHAYAGLAEGYALLGHGPDPLNAPWHKGKAAAVRALELDPNSAKAHSAMAMIQLYYERDWKAAERSFKIAEKLNPNLPYNHYHKAWYLILLGKWDEAVKEHRLAKQLDPLAPLITSGMGYLYYYMGRYDDAIKELEQALEIDREFAEAWQYLGDVHIAKGMVDKGIECHKKAMAINPVLKWSLGTAYARVGDKKKALSIASELKNGKITTRNAFGLTAIYTLLGDIDEAVKWLRHEPSDVYVPWLRTWPGLESLRKDARFQQYLKELNLPSTIPNTT